MQDCDIAIVGGGMTGLTLALALSGNGLKIIVIEPSPPDLTAFDGDPQEWTAATRVSAVSLASQRLLTQLGVWQGLVDQRVCAYREMDVRERDSFGQIHFSGKEVQQPHLGHIVENEWLRVCLWRRLQQCADVTLLLHHQVLKMELRGHTNILQMSDQALLTARLLVGADGPQSQVRQAANFASTFWDYEQRAIVATVRTALPHEQIARQVFTPRGPLAFLPLWQPQLSSIVWSQDNDSAEQLLQLSQAEFSKRLAVEFDMQLGVCELLSEPQAFPLRMQSARQWVDEGGVIIGDAAHTVHPLAGQGANLSLLDAAALAETISSAHEQQRDFGQRKQLRGFERWRKAEATKLVAVMEGFKQLFAGDDPVKKLLRGLGMSLTHSLPTVKIGIMRQALGLSGKLPQRARTQR